MHRDTQIGLAMSIVLIGFAAALCFPRSERPRVVAGPAPSGFEELDRAIEQLPVRAYIDKRPSAHIDADSLKAVPSVSTPNLHSSTGEVRDSSPPAESITGSEPLPEDLELLRSSDVAGPDPQAEPSSELIHVVQSGDTLSGLAQRYLGGVGRYQEIFAANRDLLESPDDLRLGMRLRIPAGAD